MHPPLVVPDALRLSGLAALSGVPLHGGDPADLLSAAASTPALQQLRQKRQAQPSAAATAFTDSVMQRGGEEEDAAAHGGFSEPTPVPPAAAADPRRPAEHAAELEPGAKRRRKPSASGHLPSGGSSKQQATQPTVVSLADVPEGVLEAMQGGNPPHTVPMDVDAGHTAAVVRWQPSTQLNARLQAERLSAPSISVRRPHVGAFQSDPTCVLASTARFPLQRAGRHKQSHLDPAALLAKARSHQVPA